MGYVVVVFAIINSAAMIAMGLLFAYVYRELPMYVSTAVSDEVRKQDDRIEKRLAKLAEPRENGQDYSETPASQVRAGVPVRRR